MPRGSLLALFCAPLVFGCSSPPASGPDSAVIVDMGLPPPATLAQAQTLTSCLAIDSNAVYWTDQGSGSRVLKVALAGGTPEVVATGGDQPGCVAIDATSAYYTDGQASMVMRAPLSGGGGPGTAIAQSQHVLPEKRPLLVSDGSYVYWITDVYGNVDAYNGKNAIVRVPVAGGSVEVVADVVMGEPAGLAVDANSVYFSDSTGLYAQPKSGGAPAAFPAQSTIHSNPFATDGTNLASIEVSGLGAGDVALFRIDGSGRTVVSKSLAASLAVDASGVYAKQDNHLVRFSLDGSKTVTLALAAPRAIALSAGGIYFTDGASILKLSK